MAAIVALQLIADLAGVRVWAVTKGGVQFAQLVERGETGRCPVELVLPGKGAVRVDAKGGVTRDAFRRTYRHMGRARLALGVG
jgi:hypothetical protein